MRTPTTLLVFALARQVLADAYDNTDEAASIASAASTLSGAGDYLFTNVATGQTLSFVRGDLSDLFPNDGSDSLAIQFDGSQARLSGANNKCVSAQWSTEGRGYDHAAVSYACKVGKGLLTGTDTLEPTKQWWYLVPASPSSSSGSPSTTSSASSSASASPTGGLAVGVQLAALVDVGSGSDKSSSSGFPSSDSTEKGSDKNTSGVIPGDRSTWICKHSGKWVYDRPGYIDIHPECRKDLDAYKATLTRKSHKRRATHHEMAAHLFAKRAAPSYYIIAVDHILDQVTRAISSDSIATWGGYTSTTLEEWDRSDDNQRWIITAA